jgi:beta-1,4-mannosyltransferase
MKNVYFFPNKPILNPYAKNLINSFSENYNFINANKPSKTGIFDILKYILKIDFVFLNWIEDLTDRRGGIIQSLAFIFIIKILKIKGVKIVWTLHNKLSHFNKYLFIKRILKKAMIKNSNYILTHSTEGIEYANYLSGGIPLNIRYLPHPVQRRKPGKVPELIYDIIIWGNIIPYKGIDKFLEFLFSKNCEHKYKILIIGQSDSEQYLNRLKKFENKNIIIENRFINESELIGLIRSSRIVLFTYTKTSVLSSGALMDSLGLGPEIIGPDTGAFADLASLNVIHIYRNLDELLPIIDDVLNKKMVKNIQVEKFIEENSWENFSKNFHSWLKENKNNRKKIKSP